MFQKIIHNCTFIRFIRLILGVFIIIQSVQTQNYWMILPGILFSAMALFNTSCCGASCSVPIKNKKK